MLLVLDDAYRWKSKVCFVRTSICRNSNEQCKSGVLADISLSGYLRVGIVSQKYRKWCQYPHNTARPVDSTGTLSRVLKDADADLTSELISQTNYTVRITTFSVSTGFFLTAHVQTTTLDTDGGKLRRYVF
jgi:hypothetical protein